MKDGCRVGKIVARDTADCQGKSITVELDFDNQRRLELDSLPAGVTIDDSGRLAQLVRAPR